MKNTTSVPNDNQPPRQRVRRSPLIAALMSASLPGFGQLYNGQLNKAAWIFVIFASLTIPVSAAIALWLPAPLTVPLQLLGGILAISVWLYAIINAWITARHRDNYTLRPWQTSGLYAVVFIICNLITMPLLTISVRTHLVQPFTTPSNSMSPTVLAGDYLFANMSYNCPYCLAKVNRGDIAILINPNKRNFFYIKRVIGLPGDSIEISNNQLLINGESAQYDTSDQQHENFDRVKEQSGNRQWEVQWQTDKTEDFPATIVEPGHVFVLGDNRDASNDSRLIGQIPLSDIKGLARQIWFSRSKEGIRWDRIGLDLTTR